MKTHWPLLILMALGLAVLAAWMGCSLASLWLFGAAFCA